MRNLLTLFLILTVSCKSTDQTKSEKNQTDDTEILQSKIEYKDILLNHSTINDQSKIDSFTKTLKRNLDNTWWKYVRDSEHHWYRIFFDDNNMYIYYFVGGGKNGEIFKRSYQHSLTEFFKYNKSDNKDLIFFEAGISKLSYYEKKDKLVTYIEPNVIHEKVKESNLPPFAKERAVRAFMTKGDKLEKNLIEIEDKSKKQILMKNLDNTWWKILDKDSNSKEEIWYRMFFVGDQMQIDYFKLAQQIDGSLYKENSYFRSTKFFQHNKLDDENIVFFKIEYLNKYGNVEKNSHRNEILSYDNNKNKIVVNSKNYAYIYKNVLESKVPSNIKERKRAKLYIDLSGFDPHEIDDTSRKKLLMEHLKKLNGTWWKQDKKLYEPTNREEIHWCYIFFEGDKMKVKKLEEVSAGFSPLYEMKKLLNYKISDAIFAEASNISINSVAPKKLTFSYYEDKLVTYIDRGNGETIVYERILESKVPSDIKKEARTP
jgi:hypothetical protein